MLKTKKRITALLLAMTAAMGISAAASETVQVKLSGLASNVMEFVTFDEVSPMTVDGSTLVPLRSVCETAGLTVEWDQSSQTAYISLKADSQSEKPIEQHAWEMMWKVPSFGLTLTPDKIVVALKLGETTASIRYRYLDEEGDPIAMGREMELQTPATLVNDGSLMIPLRGVMEAFSLEVEWDGKYHTARVSIPENAHPLNALILVAEKAQTASAAVQAAPQAIAPEAAYETVSTVQTIPAAEPLVIGASSASQKGEYIGKFKITHYCPCAKCNGSYGGTTAWAGKLNPGVTIAVDPSVIKKLSWVYIEGYGVLHAEDCGGAIKGNRIDICVGSHEEAMRLGVKYCDVWYAA